MTNDELLSGFLDRSLSEDELLDFEARKAASPDFAREAQHLVALESMLATHQPATAAPTQFLASVEDRLAAAITAPAAATAAANAPSMPIGAWIAIAATGLVATGALVVALMSGQPDAAAPPAASDVRTEAVSPAAVPPATTTTTDRMAAPAAAPTASSAPTIAHPAPSVAERATPTDAVNSATARAQQPDPILDRLERRFAETTGSRKADYGLQLGRRLAERSPDRAATVFRQAMATADAERLVQYQVDLRIALADLRGGTEARTLLEDALRMADGILPGDDVDALRARLANIRP